VALGGKTILSEFPELCGVEQELINRCTNDSIAEKFSGLMKAYAASAEAVGSGFDMNPSPGNIKDGLITDAMKSSGAAKKGGTSPVVDVLDYAEYAIKIRSQPSMHSGKRCGKHHSHGRFRCQYHPFYHWFGYANR
jgi:altronate hydrolase